MKKPRIFKLGFIGMLTTSGLTFGFIGYIWYYLMNIHLNEGAHISQQLAREIYQENNKHFGRRTQDTIKKETEQEIPKQKKQNKPSKVQYI